MYFRLVAAALLGTAVVAPVILSHRIVPPAAAATQTDTEWRYYGGTLGGTHYAPLTQITESNTKDLKIVWRVPASPPEVLKGRAAPVGGNFEHTPLMIGGILYMRSEAGPVVAMDPATGKMIWADAKASIGGRSRGISYWTDGSDARIFALDGSDLVALNAKTGERYPNFGSAGKVDLTVYGDPRPNSPVKSFSWSSFPVVVGNIVVIAGVPEIDREKIPPGIKPGLDAPGDIRGYDVRTGKLAWTFHVIPRPGEYGYDTWKNKSADVNGLGGSWSWMTGDEDLGYVYIPTEAASNDFYGGHRPGNDLFADSILCLDAKTGKRVWHFQTIHHEIWDFDNPTAPVLTDITVGGKKVKALVQLTKQAYAFVLDRTNGKPVWPIEEKPVPQGSIAGEVYSPTQPVPTKPGPLELQQLTEKDLIDFTPELHAQALEIFKQFTAGPVFTPAATDREMVMLPGTTGAANWNGSAFDPDTGMLYVPVIRNAVRTVNVKGGAESTFAYDRKGEPLLNTNVELPYVEVSPAKGVKDGDPTRLPITKPPYGSIVAIDLNQGEIKWKVANGDGPRFHPSLKYLNLPPLGTQNRAVPLVTKTLLFIGEGHDGPGGPSRIPAWGGGKKFRAYDKVTGKVIWETDLGAGTSGGPITYMLNGKQYIVVAVGWHDRASELVAMALP
jgi:quinoprotein glucose dehydrogenase